MEKGAGRLGCPAMVLTLQENLGSPSGLIQAVRVGVSVISFAAIFAISCLIESVRATLGCLGEGWRVIFSNPIDRGLKTYMITQSSSVPETLLRQISAEGAVRLLYSFTPLTKSVPPVLQCYGLSQYKHLLSIH